METSKQINQYRKKKTVRHLLIWERWSIILTKTSHSKNKMQLSRYKRCNRSAKRRDYQFTKKKKRLSLLSMTNASVMISTVDRIIAFNGDLFSSAFVSASSAFVVSASWCRRPNHMPPWVLYENIVTYVLQY